MKANNLAILCLLLALVAGWVYYGESKVIEQPAEAQTTPRAATPTPSVAQTSPSPSAPVWSVELQASHGSGKSWNGGQGITVSSDGMARSVSWQNGVAGPQPHNSEGPVNHPEKLAALGKILRDPALLKQAAQPSSGETTLTFTIDGTAHAIHSSTGKFQGAAAKLQKALDEVLGRDDQQPQQVQPLAWTITLEQPSPDPKGPWESRSFEIDSQGRLTSVYSKRNPRLSGTYASEEGALNPQQLATLEKTVTTAASGSPGDDNKAGPVTLTIWKDQKPTSFRGSDGNFSGPAARVIQLVDQAFGGTHVLQRPWRKVD